MKKCCLHNIVYILLHYSFFTGTLLKLENRGRETMKKSSITLIRISFFCANSFKALKHQRIVFVKTDYNKSLLHLKFHLPSLLKE